MAELERTRTIPLAKSIEDKDLKTTYEMLNLQAPTLSQAEQFFQKQSAENALSAMRLLIMLVSGVRETALQQMDFVDYRKCEEFLLGFLTWKS